MVQKGHRAEVMTVVSELRSAGTKLVSPAIAMSMPAKREARTKIPTSHCLKLRCSSIDISLSDSDVLVFRMSCLPQKGTLSYQPLKTIRAFDSTFTSLASAERPFPFDAARRR